MVRRGVQRRRARRRQKAWAIVLAVWPLLALLHLGALFLVADELAAERAEGLRSHAADTTPRDLPAVATDDGSPLEIEQLVDTLKRPEEEREEERRDEEEKKKEEQNPKADGQVVDLARPTIEEHPDNAKFLSEYDSKVEHETRGKAGRAEAGNPVAVVQPQRHVASSPPRPRAPSGNPESRPGAPGPLAMRETERVPIRGQNGPMVGDREELGPDGTLRRPGSPGTPAPPRRPQPKGQGGVPGKHGLPNLKPTDDMIERAIGAGPGSMDYLKDIDDGESTALNAKKWVHALFFNRVKRAVAENWHPDIVYLRHDPSGNVYGAKDRTTVVRVHLHPDGTISALTLLQASGVDFLDDEAMDALRRAQPFVNPPKQLVDSDGLIHFNFGFTFELSGHTSFRVFRYQ